MNKVILMGRLTKDPEMKQTGSGVSLCTFTIAVDRRYKDSSGERPTDFIYCTAWRQTAEFISRYFSKGQSIAVVGSIQTSSWEGQDGRRQYRTDVVIEEAYFTGSKSQGGDYQPSQTESGRRFTRSSEEKADGGEHKAPAEDYSDFEKVPDDLIMPFDL